jgi:CubicO group peptidase (beta-lactamase class C family)
MRRTRRAILLLGAAGFSACAIAPGRETAADAELRSQLQKLVDGGKIPGAVVLIGRGRHVMHRSVIGFQDVVAKTPIRFDTLFRLYSMSKPITSAAIMALAEQQRLSIDDMLERHLPEFRNLRVYAAGSLADMQTVPAKKSITIADLLTHTSGITYHFTGEGPVQQYYRANGVMRDTPVGRRPTDAPPAPDLDELMRRLGRAPLLHQPGETFAYSYSTTVLGAVIERVTGQRLDAALEALVLKPLRMKNTGFFVDDAALPRFIPNYSATKTGVEVVETPQASDYRQRYRLLDGGGALVGTADDYYRFARLFAEGGEVDGARILSPAAVRDMLSPRVRTDAAGGGFEFGYGLQIGNMATQASGQIPNGSVGWSGSGNTFFWVDPHTKGIVVFMTQVLTPAGFEPLSARLRRVVMGPALRLLQS